MAKGSTSFNFGALAKKPKAKGGKKKSGGGKRSDAWRVYAGGKR
jgi:hypothetical protein